jgi:hydroxymethylbilane synthase
VNRPDGVIILGSRGSMLALWQAEHVKALVEAQTGRKVEIFKIKTTGDIILDVPLAKVGGKGLFVKEIEEALLNGTIDFAVHSMKDVPTELPAELDLCCITKREDPRDAFLSKRAKTFQELPQGAKVGTSSLRRQTQLLAARPDLTIDQLRGNLDTRIRKMEEGQYDAIILAAAGLRRLGWADKISSLIEPEVSLPAVGQGALGIEIRRNDDDTRAAVAFLNDPETAFAVRAERAFLTRLEGGCQVPIGAFAQTAGDTVTLRGLVGRPDGSETIRGNRAGSTADPEGLGIALADELLGRGAKSILDEVYAASKG